jgi:hypothetical protein
VPEIASEMRQSGWVIRPAECLDGVVAAVADPELLAVLEGMRAAGLAQWWAGHAEGDLLQRCGDLRESFAAYDLVPLVERHTGTVFDARAVELCVLRWAAPHGIRVTGTRFLTDVRYNADTVLNIAVHELLHPPWPKRHPVKGCLDALAADPFLAARFAGRDPAAGYNSWASYAEEDAAQALDQFLNTRLGRNTRVTRWRGGPRPTAACTSSPCCCMTPCVAAVSTPRTAATPISSPWHFLTGAPGLAIPRLVTSN